MQFIIEDNIDFFKELNSITENTDCSKCLITNMPLEDNFVTLSCSHTFNYIPMFEELRNQKKINYLETKRLTHNQMKCPYCRIITNNILPYFVQYKMPLIYGVNIPERYSLLLHKCEYKFKSGKMKNAGCYKTACKSCFGNFCNSHYKMMVNKEEKKNKKILTKTMSKLKTSTLKPVTLVNNSSIIDFPEVGFELVENKVVETFYNIDEVSYKKKTIVELKKILRVNGCKVSGKKQELVDRVLLYKLKKGNLWIKHE